MPVSSNPLVNAIVRALVEGVVLGLAAMVGYMTANEAAEFLSRNTVLAGATVFLGVLALRGGFEGVMDSRSSVQKTADAAKHSSVDVGFVRK